MAINYYEQLNALRIANPALTLNNDGYENIPADVKADNIAAFAAVEKLLQESVQGFVSFQNFKPRKNGTYAVRCQTRWDERFTGVSYIPLEDFRPDSAAWTQAESAND